MAKAYSRNFPVNPDRADPGKSLPKVLGYSVGDFSSRKEYQNTQARIAGYENYNAWIKARKTAGVSDPKNRGRSKGYTYRDRQVYKIKFSKNGVTDGVYENAEIELDKIVSGAPDDFIVQVFLRGNLYGGKDIEKPSEFKWVNMLPTNVSELKEGMERHGTLTEFLRQEVFPTVRDFNDKNRGISEIHIAFFASSKTYAGQRKKNKKK